VPASQIELVLKKRGKKQTDYLGQFSQCKSFTKLDKKKFEAYISKQQI
jgi:hypothetical protein